MFSSSRGSVGDEQQAHREARENPDAAHGCADAERAGDVLEQMSQGVGIAEFVHDFHLPFTRRGSQPSGLKPRSRSVIHQVAMRPSSHTENVSASAPAFGARSCHWTYAVPATRSRVRIPMFANASVSPEPPPKPPP